MKIVSWNVAGIRACIRKGFVDFFNHIDADIFCVQESKAMIDQYDFHPDGYYEYLFPAVIKGYSGTLIFTKIKPLEVVYGIGDEEYDLEGRVITMEYDSFYMVNVYVPNVKRTLERMDSRMRFEDLFRRYLKKLDSCKPVIVTGDFNVAHTELDIKNAKQNVKNAGFTKEERDKFTELLNSGFVDTFRYYHPLEEGHYTWWSYMKGVRERNIGWRIDYFLVSERIISQVSDTNIYANVYGSDHCPIGLSISF